MSFVWEMISVFIGSNCHKLASKNLHKTRGKFRIHCIIHTILLLVHHMQIYCILYTMEYGSCTNVLCTHTSASGCSSTRFINVSHSHSLSLSLCSLTFFLLQLVPLPTHTQTKGHSTSTCNCCIAEIHPN